MATGRVWSGRYLATRARIKIALSCTHYPQNSHCSGQKKLATALEQTTENQRREVEAAGFAIKLQRLIEEHISGSVTTDDRPGFIRLFDRMENGDVLIVTKLDRLGAMRWISEKGGTNDYFRYSR